MVSAAVRELEQTSVSERPQTILADAGYWHTKQIEKLRGDGFEVLVPPDSTLSKDARPGWEGGIYDAMRQSLRTPEGRQLYLKRSKSIEPVFGQIKHNRGMTRFRRRGRAAARSEWRLITASHNLLKLHNHWIAPAARVNRQPRSRFRGTPLTVTPLSDILGRSCSRRLTAGGASALPAPPRSRTQRAAAE